MDPTRTVRRGITVESAERNRHPMNKKPSPIKGRGAASNPPIRFSSIERILDSMDAAPSCPKTIFYSDVSRSIVTYNTSPDVGFDAGINCYRGCEHGCAYCYARPTHEYLGLSAGLDFETKIFVKRDAPALLRKALSHPKWKPTVLTMSSVTDPYQPIEKRLRLTRRCLEVLLAFRNPVAIITKNSGVMRDVDLLSELARHDLVAVYLSIPTLNKDLQRVLEPRTAPPDKRLAAISALSKAGIPTGVMVAPVIPGLTDHEIPAILQAVATSGGAFA
ncbi:MAG: radical SAM protein, partial [Nitrospiria bacterium]